MRTSALIAGLLLCGCGPRSATATCTATFAGNFVDSSSGSCPTVGTVFRFRADAPSVNSTLTGSIELGPGAVPSTITSQAAPGAWTAVLTREPGCVYSAGRDVVPSGSFVLVLDSINPAHGALEVTQYVHALPMADCGRGDLETVRLEF